MFLRSLCSAISPLVAEKSYGANPTGLGLLHHFGPGHGAMGHGPWTMDQLHTPRTNFVYVYGLPMHRDLVHLPSCIRSFKSLEGLMGYTPYCK